jgi:hypothetical protein
MVLRLADNRRPDSLATQFRNRRFGLFLELCERRFAGQATVRLLDVGGTFDFWMQRRDMLPGNWTIDVCNVEEPKERGFAGLAFFRDDARTLASVSDGAYDAVFSNSVIEHVGGLDDMRAMAGAVRRVAKAYFVQTPYLHFPLEPHALTPGYQYAPFGVRTVMHRMLPLGWYPRAGNWQRAREMAHDSRLVTRSQMRDLFPDATIWLERKFGLVKSMVAYDGFGDRAS